MSAHNYRSMAEQIVDAQRSKKPKPSAWRKWWRKRCKQATATTIVPVAISVFFVTALIVEVIFLRAADENNRDQNAVRTACEGHEAVSVERLSFGQRRVTCLEDGKLVSHVVP